MSIRKMRALLTGAALLLATLVVPMASPADAHGTASGTVSICAVAGTVFVDAVGQIPPGAPGGSAYSFNNVAIVCVGNGDINGVSTSTTSNGSTGTGCGDPFPIPGTFGAFCGSYNANFNGGTCNGNLGGPGLWDQSPVFPAPNATPDSWSLTLGPVILGHVDCGGGSNGVIALVAVPTSPNSIPIPVANPDGGAIIPIDPVPLLGLGRSCPSTGPATIPVVGQPAPVGPVVWACSIFVAGTAVIVDPGHPLV